MLSGGVDRRATSRQRSAATLALSSAEVSAEVPGKVLMFRWLMGPPRKQLQAEIERLSGLAREIDRARQLEATYGPIEELDRQRQAIEAKIGELTETYERKRAALEAYGPVEQLGAKGREIAGELAALEDRVSEEEKKYRSLAAMCGRLEADLEWQEIGIYRPVFDFRSTGEYKAALDQNLERQKAMVKERKAVICATSWTVNGSRRAGDTMVGQNIRLCLRAFNNECEAIIGRVTWRNLDASRERIRRAFEQIIKLTASKQIEVTSEYLNLKLVQLTLVHEHAARLQEEKEEARRVRELERENARAQREIEEALRRTEEEEAQYAKALAQARADLQADDTAAMRARIADLEAKLERARAEHQRAASMAQITRSGYVYIISNIGSFGKRIFKVGMTRRIDPMERIYELGDASVPFGFDVHSMIWSEDAPGLERALHQRLDSCRVNKVNYRREFFACDVQTLRSTLAECAPDAGFCEEVEAEQFRRSTAFRDVDGLDVDDAAPQLSAA